jgi:hypothetical protein
VIRMPSRESMNTGIPGLNTLVNTMDNYSPISAIALSITDSDKYIPCCFSSVTIGRAAGIIPLFLAIITNPKVPLKGSPRVSAQ